MQKIQVIGLFFDNRVRWQFENWGKNLRHKKDVVQLQLENVYLKGQADPDNWLSE
jgi:hypothetical protein